MERPKIKTSAPMEGNTMKPRNPASKLRSEGALRTRVIADKRRKQGRKSKHKGSKT